ncbi:MAG: tol-pal system-associated acyl-CoA thioesterase [Alphaproteobacteria bacterium]|nr:tol-pal system-associated acyl-CoA thioesterase [Alphaproteobacteria bacterium]
MDIRVYYEDTDAGGVVYHGNYLNFGERGRTEFLRAVGFENKKLADTLGIIFVVRHIEIDYLKTAHLDDMLTQETTILEMKNSSFIMHQKLLRDGELISDMRVVLVCVETKNYTPVRLPENVKEAFQRYQEPV